jgi:hypothetical protein
MFKRSWSLFPFLCSVVVGLVLPAARADEPLWVHTVERGDTLIGLRDRMLRPDADWRELQRLNRIVNPRRLVPGSQLQIPTSMLLEQPLEVEVLHSHGTATVQRRGGPAEPLVSGTNLAAGDVVSTGPQSSAALRFADGTRVLLRPESVLRIERSMRRGSSPTVATELRLEEGSVDSRVPRQRSPRFEIRTPVANLGVRGTEFRTRATADQTTIEVLDGQVASPPSAAQTIAAGFGALATTQGVTPSAALAAAPDLSGLPVLVERLPLQLKWDAPADAQFRAQVFDTTSLDKLLLDGLFQGGLARWGDDLPDGRYRLLVRALGEQGIEGRDSELAFTLKARPEPPFPTFPRDGARMLSGPVEFAWTRPVQAARYHLQLADNPTFTAPLIDRDDLLENGLRVELPLGPWHWRLASVRADGDHGPWSDVVSVTAVALPPSPEGQPPQFGDEGVLLMWRERVGARYQVQVAGDAGFAKILFDVQVERPQWLLRQPAAGRYHVRVRTTDADGFTGPWGELQQVNVPRSRWWWLLALPLLTVF